MSLSGFADADSSTIFTYYVRSARASASAVDSRSALRALDAAEAWAAAEEDRALLEAERAWLLWDDGNLVTRMRWDSLTALAQLNPGGAAKGMAALASDVRRFEARIAVRHQLALLFHQTGRNDLAMASLSALWKELDAPEYGDGAQFDRVREDYGALAFNMARDRMEAGDRRTALAYLLQSEATGYSRAPLAALHAARLLGNNNAAALEAAHRAEAGIERMEAQERVMLPALFG